MKIKQSNNLKKLINALIGFILMGVMAFSITYIIIYAMELTYSPIKLITIIFITQGILAITLMNKLTTRVTLIGLVFIGIVGSIYLYRKKMLIDVWDITRDELIWFGEWCTKFVAGMPTESGYYVNYFIILLGIVMASLTYFFTVKKFSFPLFFIGGTSLLVFEVIQNQPIHTHAFYLLVFTNLIYFFKGKYLRLQKQLDKSSYNIYDAFMKTSICIVISIFVGAVLLARTYPYKATWVHSLVEQLSQEKSSGLQTEDTSLGGDIKLSDVVVLEVESSAPTYLKATSRDVYTGSGWTREDKAAPLIYLETGMLEDTTETLEAIDWIRRENKSLDLDSLFYKQTAHIRFMNINTNSIFIPSKMESFHITSSQRDVFLSGSDSLSLEKPATKDFAYTTEFYEPKWTSDSLRDVLRKSEVGFYKTKGINKWVEHADAITKKYTQIPEQLPERIIDLAQIITRDQDNNYDKVKAIEAYLASNYDYTLTPGDPIEGNDFVDTFLFENKQGYCTYFATALAVLTRSIGIPSRYVEGYVMPPSPKSQQNTYIITDKSAHAWVEVYFEGIGWIRFEATPPYRQLETISQAAPMIEEAMSITETEIEVKPFNRVEISPSSMEKVKVSSIYKMLIILSVGIIVVLIFLYQLRRHHIMKRSTRSIILSLYKAYLRVLSLQGVVIKAGETERVFASRVDEIISFRELNFKEITEVYLVARYSQLEIEPQQKQKMLDFRNVLLKVSRKKMNILSYIMCIDCIALNLRVDLNDKIIF